MYTRSNNNSPNQYLLQKIMTASPNQLVAYIYDAGATACMQKDADKARRAVQLLVNGLNFDVKEVSKFAGILKELSVEPLEYQENLRKEWE